MKILTLALAAALCAPALAQKMGMTNTNAPTIKQTITANDVTMSLDYTSITWADGATMTRLADKENGARVRERVNKTAPNEPLATFKSSVDVKFGDVSLPAGEYQVYFTVGDDLAWSLNFKSGDKVHTTKLQLSDATGHESKRLLMSLYAGDGGGAGVYLAFGKMGGMLNITPAPKNGGK